MADRKATYIEIRYDDGLIETAQGEAATKIMEWWGACEVMNLIHGAHYHGPQFTKQLPDSGAEGEGQSE